MAKGDSTGASATPEGTGAMTRNGAIQQQLGMYPAGQGVPPGQAMGNMGQGFGGGGGWQNRWQQQPQQQQNPLFQNMDPRLVQLFQKYNVNPTGTGTGNSDIAYWNSKMSAPGADQQYFLNRLESDFGGTGPDLGNNNLTYGGQQGNLAGRYYQQPMQRRGLQRMGGNNRFPTQPRMGMGGQQQPQRFGGYTNRPSGLTPPTFNPNTTPRPTPAPDTSEHPK